MTNVPWIDKSQTISRHADAPGGRDWFGHGRSTHDPVAHANQGTPGGNLNRAPSARALCL
jgi:hypothetical protein